VLSGSKAKDPPARLAGFPRRSAALGKHKAFRYDDEMIGDY